MSYLHTEEGKAAAMDALQILNDSQKIEDLISQMSTNRKRMKDIIPHLPDWLQRDLISEHFTLECLSYFEDLDKDGNGHLDPQELFPMVLSLCRAHKYSLDLEQCRRFTAIFDDA